MLDFSDKSFSEFFASELKVNIDDPKYAVNGSSKGKRLRYFLQHCDDATAVRTLAALWEHRSEYLARTASKDPVVNAETRYQGLVNRLSGNPAPKPAAAGAPATAIDRKKIEKAKSDLLQITALTPQARGYAFESFLKDLFDAPPRNSSASAASRSRAASSLAVKFISSKRNGRGNPSASPICTSFMARSSRRQRGPAASSSAIAASPMMVLLPSDEASASSAWMVSTFTRCWIASFRSPRFSSAKFAVPQKPARRSSAFVTSFHVDQGEEANGAVQRLVRFSCGEVGAHFRRVITGRAADLGTGYKRQRQSFPATTHLKNTSPEPSADWENLLLRL